MSTQHLSRRSHRPKSGQVLIGDLTLTRARAHEFCGAARRTLALILAQDMDGDIYWIRPGWGHDHLHAEGVVDFINPGRITTVAPKRPEDLLWCMEEILRAGCVPLVVCELPGPAHMTPVRRLHLAAETGAREGSQIPLGLLLTPGNGGSQGVESRWHMAPRHAADVTRWHLERRRDRMAPVAAWELQRAKGRFSMRALAASVDAQHYKADTAQVRAH